MGRYAGSYFNIANEWRNMNLNTRFVDTVLGRNELATDEQDAIIPSIWFDSVTANRRGCPFTITRGKYVELYVNTSQFVYVIVPWRENTVEYNVFFEEVLASPVIVRVRLFGELITDTNLRWLIRVN